MLEKSHNDSLTYQEINFPIDEEFQMYMRNQDEMERKLNFLEQKLLLNDSSQYNKRQIESSLKHLKTSDLSLLMEGLQQSHHEFKGRTLTT